MKYRRLPLDMYNRCVTVVVGSVEEINKRIIKDLRSVGENMDGITPLSQQSLGKWLCYERNGYDADYIFIVNRGNRAERMAVLCHEALHCVSHALRKAGIEHSDATEEAYTYYLQYLVRECAKDVA